MNKVLIISNHENDVSKLILNNCPDAAVYDAENDNIPFEKFESLCILGGAEEKQMIIPSKNRIEVDKFIQSGKPIFCEFVASVAGVYGGNPQETTHHRLVYSDEYVDFARLKKGDILDGHYNDVLSYYFVPDSARPVLTYHDYICAHDNIEMDDETFRSGKLGLWYLNDKVLISSFRLCNFNRARLAPRDSWLEIIQGIVEFLAGEKLQIKFPDSVCTAKKLKPVTCAEDVCETVKRGLEWFKNAGMLKNNGKYGVYEGFSHLISARDGKQLTADGIDKIRADCTGETGGAFLFDYLITGNKESYEIYQNTESFCFDYMQVKDGEHRGMVRWTETAWEICYQDDVARAILPTLLNQNFGVKTPYFKQAVEALEFLANTTGEDGLRVNSTCLSELTEDKVLKLKKAGSGRAYAHFNAYYHAALLLAVRAGADERFADVAVKGLTTIMNLYPDNLRETSETEEMCRLVFPLAVLYEYTKEKKHYEWLMKVVADLEKVQHPSGGYAEWDTGYKANCSRNHKGECALLANNGDPVADLLYSNNWLPLGFAYAYMVTKDECFYNKWKEITTFLMNCQVYSEDKLLDGAWTRAMDMERMESYGVPHDVGWAPCCIETGWTVGEILMGLQFMELVERIVK